MRKTLSKKIAAGTLAAAMLSSFALPALAQDDCRPVRPVRPVYGETDEVQAGEAQKVIQYLIPSGQTWCFNGSGQQLDCPWQTETPAQPGTDCGEPAEPQEPGTPVTPPVTPEEPATPAEPTEPGQPAEDEFAAYRQQVVDLVNAERAEEGVEPLVVLDTVTEAANVRAQEIDSVFSHTRPDGSSCFTLLQALNAGFRTMGENIAKGHGSAQEVMEGWMNSAGHRKNIMNPEFTGIGVGVYRNSAGVLCWSQFFVG